ncbi:MAG: ribosome small subunit-dependent GTPase A [Acidimicrobiales bacterium]
MTEPVQKTEPSSHPLSAWGWDDAFQLLFDPIARPGLEPGRVLRADLGACVVALDRAEGHLPVARSLLARGGGQPTTGDWIVAGNGEIVEILERRTAVVRASADAGRSAQVLAANVDFVLVAEPLGERWRPRRLERLLVVAWQSGAVPIVVLTKTDRCDDVGAAVEMAMRVAPGVAVHAVSPLSGEGTGPLAAELARGTTTVIIGRSGAGKSTLANILSGGVAGLATRAVRDDGKGRHTTVTRELVVLRNGALLIDTPGVRSIGLVDSGEAIGDAFSDVESLVPGCRFSDCAHDTEPGCAVTEAITTGALDAERLESYRRLCREQERLDAREDPRVRAERAAQWRAFSKQTRKQAKR